MKNSARCPDYEMQIAWKRHIDFLAHCRSAKTVALAWIHFRRAVMRWMRREKDNGLRARLGRLAFHDPVSAIDSLYKVLVNLEQIHCEIYSLLKGLPVNESDIASSVIERPDWLPPSDPAAGSGAAAARRRSRRRADKA
jgi:hypothetical protein